MKFSAKNLKLMTEGILSCEPFDKYLKRLEEKQLKVIKKELQKELDEKGATITFPDGTQFVVEPGNIQLVDDIEEEK